MNGELDEKYKQIAKLINKYNPKGGYVEANSIGAVMFEEIQKYLNNKHRIHLFQTTNKTKKDYIGLISVAIANKELTLDINNKMLFAEMGTFTYKLTKNGTITFAAIEPNHDDTVISLGLAMQAQEDLKNPYTKSNFEFMDIQLKQFNIF